MQSKSVYKIPNGKLIKIFLDYDDKNKLIDNIRITGDFFAYPEESIDVMEKILKNTLLTKKELLEKINSIVKKYKIEFIGLNAEGLVEGILRCIK
jgi:lipoate-protein ligase A